MNWYKKIIANTLTIDNEWVTSKRTIPIELNPSLEITMRLANQSKWGQARMLPTPDGWYVWPADMAIHAAVIGALGLTKNIVDWDADGPVAKIDKDNNLLIWLPPESGNSQMSLPWANQLEPYNDPEWNYYVPAQDDMTILKSQPVATEEAFNIIDKPASPYYTRWGD